MSIRDEIIVLREIQYKDYDKILHCFSKKYGKIQIMAKRVRKSHSENSSVSLTFNHSGVNLIKNKDMYILLDGDVINNYYKIQNHYKSYVYGSYTLEILNHILQENESNIKLFEMTIKLFQMLSVESEGIESLMAAYEIKLISLMGFRPLMDRCISCDVRDELCYLSVEEGGVICKSCAKTMLNLIKFDANMLYELDFLIRHKFEDIIKIEIHSKTIQFIHVYFMHHAGKDNFKSLKLLGGDFYE
jgi:DNA repair protein RecO (recombination protein O)